MSFFNNITILNSIWFLLGILTIVIGVYRERLTKKEEPSEKTVFVTLIWIGLGAWIIIVGLARENLYRAEDNKQQEEVIRLQKDLIASQQKMAILQTTLSESQSEMIKLQREAEAKMRDDAIRTLAAELIVNANILSDPIFSETDESKMSQFVMLPRFQTAGLSRVLASGLFASNKDRQLFTQITDLHLALNDINNRLQYTQDKMADKGTILRFRKSMANSPALTQLVLKIRALQKLLIKDYGISEDESFYVILNSPREAVR